MTTTYTDRHGNRRATEGVSRCDCGCKYWENDRCVDCDTRHHPRHDKEEIMTTYEIEDSFPAAAGFSVRPRTGRSEPGSFLETLERTYPGVTHVTITRSNGVTTTITREES